MPTETESVYSLHMHVLNSGSSVGECNADKLQKTHDHLACLIVLAQIETQTACICHVVARQRGLFQVWTFLNVLVQNVSHSDASHLDARKNAANVTK
jgi:hypothetical protein